MRCAQGYFRWWYPACLIEQEEPSMAKTSPGPQTSTKAGMRSLGKKMENSRHGFATQPASRKKAGAFAQESRATSSRSEAGTSTTHAGKAAALRRVKI